MSTINGIPQEPRRSKLQFAEQSAACSYGFVPDKTRKDSSADNNDNFLKTFVDTKSNITKAQNWSQMSMSTAQGGAPLNSAYIGASFDGRYVYFVPFNSDTFVRFDTHGVFTTGAYWSHMNMSTAQGGALLNVAYLGAAFDGRYVYFVPHRSDTFIRFDTQGVFTTGGDWSHMNMSTAQGGAEIDDAYTDASFDGRYVYFVPYFSDTFVRFDTLGVFTTAGDWSQMSMSTAQGGATLDAAYRGASFDGRYVYFVPHNSDTFVRFDTLGVFTTAGDWSQMSMSTAQGGATLDAAYIGASFDGRYISYGPKYSDTFVRFDTQGVFTTAGDWSQMNMSTAQGGAEIDDAYYGVLFGGQYIYFVPTFSTTFVRFEAMKSKGAFI